MPLCPRRLRLALGILAALLLGSAADAGVLLGDLLVTDRVGRRVLAVRPGTGAVQVLSPRPGGADLLTDPAGVAMADFGIVFVVDAGTHQLIAIDAATGDQFVVRQGNGSPLPIGLDPFGLALRQTEGAYELWISARGSAEIRHVIGLVGFGIVSSALSTDARWASARGVAVAGQSLLVAMDNGQGYYSVSLDSGAISDPLLESPFIPGTPPIDRSPEVPAWDVEPYLHTVPVFPFDSISFRSVLSLQKVTLVPPFLLQCDPSATRIVAYGTLFKQFDLLNPTSFVESTVEVADGTPLRCPTALATGLDGALYVADAASPFGGSAQIVRLVRENEPTVVASLPGSTQPMGLAVAPVSVPAPSAAWTGVTALAVLFAIRRRTQRRSARPRRRRLRLPPAGAARHLVFEEGLPSACLYETLRPHVEEVIVAGITESQPEGRRATSGMPMA